MVEKIDQDSEQLAKQIKSVVIIDDASNQVAAEFLSGIKARIKRVDQIRKEFTQPLNDQVKKINNIFNPKIEFLENIEASIKGAMVKYMDEQERRAQVEAARLRKEQEEKERKAREEAERLRIEAEKAKGEKKEFLKQEAEKVEQAAMNQVHVVAEPQHTVRAGAAVVSKKKVWKWRVADEKVLREKHPELFMVNDKAMSEFVQGIRSEGVIDGIEIFQESIIAAR